MKRTKELIITIIPPIISGNPLPDWGDAGDGVFKRSLVDQPIPDNPRAYSDVFMQTVNDLANLPPFQAKDKIISWNDKSKRPILIEFDIDNLNPGEDEFIKPFYGIPDTAKVVRIIEQSRKLTKPREEVDAQITARTYGAADESVMDDFKTAEDISDND